MTALDIDAKGNLVIENLALCVKASAEGDSGVSDADLGALVRILLRLSSRGEPAAAAPAVILNGDAKQEPAAAPETPATPRPARKTRKVVTNGSSSRPGKIGYDDKVRIRQRYAEALERQKLVGKQKVPHGFVAGLAVEFGCTDSTIHNIIRNQGE